MDRKQADAIASELLEPGQEARAQRRQERAAAAARHSGNTLKAWLILAGFGCGALAAYLGGMHIIKGALLGSFAGLFIAFVTNVVRRATGERGD